MLVLSRKMGETIYLPESNTTIKILRTATGRVTLAFDAPQDVTILRGELRAIEQPSTTDLEFETQQVASKPR